MQILYYSFIYFSITKIKFLFKQYDKYLALGINFNKISPELKHRLNFPIDSPLPRLK